MYEVARDGSSTGLWVDVDEKRYGPPFLNLSIDLANRADTLSFGLGARVTGYDVGTAGAELRADIELGTTMGGRAEYYVPVAGGPLFVAARGGYAPTADDFFEDDDLAARYRTATTWAGGDVGLALGTSNEVRFGYDVGHLDASVRLGNPSLPAVSGGEQRVRLRWAFDGQDHHIVPSRGTRVTTSFDWLTEAPDLDDHLRQLSIESSTVYSFDERNRMFVRASLATSFDDRTSPLRQFTLGGPFRLSGFEIDRFRDDHLLYASAGYLRELGRLPDFAGGPIHAVASVEAGTVFAEIDRAQVRTSVGGGVLVETLIGPVLASISVSDEGSAAFYFAIGRVF